MRKKIKRIQLTLRYICFGFFLMAASSPVFAYVMESNNFRLQLEPSDIDAIPQTSIGDLQLTDDFRKDINTGETASNFLSDTNYKLIKVALIGLLIISLMIFYFKRIKTKFEIKRKK